MSCAVSPEKIFASHDEFTRWQHGWHGYLEQKQTKETKIVDSSFFRYLLFRIWWGAVNADEEKIKSSKNAEGHFRPTRGSHFVGVMDSALLTAALALFRG
jgi:hypothetical protein